MNKRSIEINIIYLKVETDPRSNYTAIFIIFVMVFMQKSINIYIYIYSEDSLDQVWANYGPGAGCGPLGFLIRPAKRIQILLLIYIMIILCPRLVCEHLTGWSFLNTLKHKLKRNYGRKSQCF